MSSSLPVQTLSLNDTTGHLQKILGQIDSFCLVTVGTFVLLEILVLYPGYHYTYRDGLDNTLVLLIGGIPITMPTALSVRGAEFFFRRNRKYSHKLGVQRNP